MSELSGHVEDYLRLRRALGFKLERAGHLLPQLVAYLEAAGAATVTSDLAIAWARLPGHTQPQPLGTAPGHRSRVCPLPAGARPGDGGPAGWRVPHPPAPADTVPVVAARHLSSAAERTSAAPSSSGGDLRGAVRAARYLRHAGRRGGRPRPRRRRPAGRGHYDPPREVRPPQAGPAAPDGHRSPVALRRPSATASARGPAARAFFVSSAGTRLDRSGVGKTLRKITTSLGMRTETVHPRAHDLRHSFAVDTLIRWQRSGLSVDEHIATLSTYLGHVSPADTYWYLSASPELMGLAAQRLHTRYGGRR